VLSQQDIDTAIKNARESIGSSSKELPKELDYLIQEYLLGKLSEQQYKSRTETLLLKMNS
jgi:ribosome-binding protein aMBF1 (putative translation factor)